MMDWKTYRHKAAKFAVYPQDNEFLYLVFGLLAEIGELFGLYAKHLRGDEITPEMWLNELGDATWFLAMMDRRFSRKSKLWERLEERNPLDEDDERLGLFDALAELQSCISGISHYGVEDDKFYIAVGCIEEMAHEFGFTMDEVRAANIAKLTARQAAGTIRGSGDNR